VTVKKLQVTSPYHYTDDEGRQRVIEPGTLFDADADLPDGLQTSEVLVDEDAPGPGWSTTMEGPIPPFTRVGPGEDAPQQEVKTPGGAKGKAPARQPVQEAEGGPAAGSQAGPAAQGPRATTPKNEK
jgi:hypothetical protein